MSKPSKSKQTEKAFCYRSGQIHFGREVPRGAIMLMEVPNQKVRDQIEVLARLSRTDDEIFIPGVPEALNDEMALNEVRHFIKVVKWALTPKDKRHKQWPKREFESCVSNPGLLFGKAGKA